MEIKIEEFIKLLEVEFEDDIKQGTLKPESNLDEQLELTSVNGLILISMAKVEYDVVLDANDFKKCKTVNDLFNVIKKKLQ
jgi:acyl carrier protein